MNTLRKKIIATGLCATMLLSTGAVNVFATEERTLTQKQIQELTQTQVELDSGTVLEETILPAKEPTVQTEEKTTEIAQETVEKDATNSDETTGDAQWLTVDGIEGGQIKFDSSTGIITDAKDTITSADIPSKIDGVSVTKIGNYAFSGCSNLTSVTIPDSVTKIGEAAFYYCRSLTGVTIPNSVTEIGGSAFSACYSLETITVDSNNLNYSSDKGILFNKNKTKLIQYPVGKTDEIYVIPNSVTEIGDYAFSSCSSLTSVTIPDSVTVIGASVFYDCDSLKEVKIPDSVTEIGSSAFSGCRSLASVTIGNSVTEIGKSAFYGCRNLTELIIPDGVTEIGESVFEDCSSLTEAIIPDGVTEIGKFAFYKCSSLTEVTIPDSVTIIKWSAFEDCSSLTNITIPDAVTEIGYGVFRGCSSLTEVTIPDSVNEIGITAFRYCSSLESITVGNNNLNYYSENGVLFNKNKTELIQYPIKKANKIYTVSGKVEKVIDLAFEGCTSLEKVTIPDSVTEIGRDVFSGCSSLDSIIVDSNNLIYSSIDGVLFNKDKTELIKYPAIKTDKFYTISDSVIEIVDRAFEGCVNLTGVTIPDSVTRIPPFSGCSSLERFTVDSKNSEYTSVKGVMFNKNKTAIIYYPSAKTDEIYSIPDTVETIAGYAFQYCSKLETIIIPKSVTTIYNLFYKCDNLENIIVDSNNMNYSSQDGILFNKNKTELIQYPSSKIDSKYQTPDSVTSIGGLAFNYCNNLTEVIIKEGVKVIGSYSFSYCAKLTYIYIPKSLTLINSKDGNGVGFGFCPNLTLVINTSNKYMINNSKKHNIPYIITTERPEITPTVDGNATEELNPQVTVEHTESMFTAEELTSGEALSLNLVVNDIDTVSKEEQKAIDIAIEEFEKTLDDKSIVVGEYLDIDLNKQVGETSTALTQLDEEITITFDIPQDMLKENKNYYMVRIHNGVAEILEDLDTNPNTITIKTDKFSTYAIAFDEEKSDVLYGDVNLDGKISIVDSIEIMKYLSKTQELTEAQLANADVTGGGVNIQDVLTIQMYMAKLIDEFPVEST